MMPYWHVFGKQNMSNEAYRISAENYQKKAQEMVDKYTVRTETTGGSMLGYSRTAMRENDKIPTSTIIKLITMASTGRLIEISDRTIA